VMRLMQVLRSGDASPQFLALCSELAAVAGEPPLPPSGPPSNLGASALPFRQASFAPAGTLMLFGRLGRLRMRAAYCIN
jgi:hypothetical protein